MPLQMPAELRFAPSGSAEALDADAMADLLALAQKIQCPFGYKSVLETFKSQFGRSTGGGSSTSSSVDWAESDLWRIARDAAKDAPGFIAAFFDACEQLQASGATVPDEAHINSVLTKYGCCYQILEGELVTSVPHVASPAAPLSPDDTVAKALADAAALRGQTGAASAIDRAHTALHGYLKHLCSEASISVPTDPTTQKLFKLLRGEHPAFQPRGPRADDISRILSSFATAIDSLSPIRNKASLAHPNPLLEEPEAAAALNAARTVFHYTQDSINRWRKQAAG